MKVTNEIVGLVNVLLFEGDLIGETSGLEVVDLVSDSINNKIHNVIFDLTSLRYMNSSGIGVMITAHTKLKNNGGELVLLNPNEQINKLLTITKLNTIFKIFLTKEEALAYLNK